MHFQCSYSNCKEQWLSCIRPVMPFKQFTLAKLFHLSSTKIPCILKPHKDLELCQLAKAYTIFLFIIIKITIKLNNKTFFFLNLIFSKSSNKIGTAQIIFSSVRVQYHVQFIFMIIVIVFNVVLIAYCTELWIGYNCIVLPKTKIQMG